MCVCVRRDAIQGDRQINGLLRNPHSHFALAFHSGAQVLNDNPKARREVDLHWRASGCMQIVQIVAVYENTYGTHKCLLVVMEW